jgi:hypothetical protein
MRGLGKEGAHERDADDNCPLRVTNIHTHTYIYVISPVLKYLLLCILLVLSYVIT